MAKKTADQLYDAFLAEILATVPEDKRGVLEDTLKSDSVKAVARERVLARSDYSRLMDEGREELKTSREALNQKIAEVKAREEQWTDWYGKASTEFATVKDERDRYAETYGALDGSNKQTSKKFVAQEDLNSLLDSALVTRDAAAIDVADQLTDLKIEHKERFGEKLDSKALIKFATDNRMTLGHAYTMFTADKVKALDEKKLNEAIAAAKAEGAREYATTHHLPVIPTGTEPLSWDRSDPKAPVGRTQHDRVAAAVAGFSGSDKA